MAGVKQVRVLRNVVCLLALCVLLLWCVRAQLWPHRAALALGWTAGLAYGLFYWWRLQPRIARRDRRYERNKVFVHYLNSLEVVITAVAYNILLAIPIGFGLLGMFFLATWSVHWWTMLGGSFGLGWAGMLASCVVWFERRHGPLYYQYNSETWSGAEGLVYQVGVVVQPLTPTGKISLAGVLWNAVSLSGEPIDVGQQVEVLSVDRLTLAVDRLPGAAEAQKE